MTCLMSIKTISSDSLRGLQTGPYPSSSVCVRVRRCGSSCSCCSYGSRIMFHSRGDIIISQWLFKKFFQDFFSWYFLIFKMKGAFFFLENKSNQPEFDYFFQSRKTFLVATIVFKWIAEVSSTLGKKWISSQTRRLKNTRKFQIFGMF